MSNSQKNESILGDGITRDIDFIQDHSSKRWFFTITEAKKEIFRSDLYSSRDECCEVGMSMMDFYHEKRPLITEDKPSWAK
jgi:hypothetical protein